MWRRIALGFNLEGVCKNKRCEAKTRKCGLTKNMENLISPEKSMQQRHQHEDQLFKLFLLLSILNYVCFWDFPRTSDTNPVHPFAYILPIFDLATVVSAFVIIFWLKTILLTYNCSYSSTIPNAVLPPAVIANILGNECLGRCYDVFSTYASPVSTTEQLFDLEEETTSVRLIRYG